MTFRQIDALSDLKDYLDTHCQPPFIPPKDNSALEADLLWDAARFWAAVINISTPTGRYRTIAQFEAFVQQYQEQTGKSVDVAQLFRKHWLRKVFGFVEIAGAVSSALYRLDEMLPFGKELKFISQFYKEHASKRQIKVPLARVEEAVEAYENAHQVALNRDGIFFRKWARKEGDQVEIFAIDIYFDPLLENWDELEFLFHWRQRADGTADSGFAVPKQALAQIQGAFAHFEGLLDKKVIRTAGDTCYIKFHGTGTEWRDLDDKIAGFYWELLIRDSQYPDDETRLITWLTKILDKSDWPNHLAYVTTTTRERFLQAAMELLLKETDVNGCEEEVLKALLDSREYKGLEVLGRDFAKYYENHQLVNEDLFELYHSLRKLEDESTISFWHHQPVRHLPGILLHSITLHDPEFSKDAGGSYIPFQRLFALLRASKDKPYFLWRIAQSVIVWRPAVLPILFTQADFCTLGLSLLDELKFRSGDAEIRQTVWTKSVSLLLESLLPVEGHEGQLATIIFQLFRQLNAEKYTIPYNRSNRQKERENRQVAEKRERAVLALVEDAPLHKGLVFGEAASYLLPAIFEQLGTRFLAYAEQPLYKNGVVQFPMVKWDGLFWLMKVATYWKYRPHFSRHSEQAMLLAEHFLEQYWASMEQREVDTYNYFEERPERATPLWSEKIERLALLDWIYPIYNIYRLNQLPSFLAIRFRFEKTEDRSHRQNDFTADKLRTHIGVLLQILRKLVLPSLPYGFERSALQDIKESIEKQVVTYLQQHSRDVPAEGRVDLFSYRKELRFNYTEKEALLPQLAQAINWFSDKERIIDVLLSTGDLVKLLTILDYIAVEGIRKKLLARIKITDLVDFLNNLHGVPEVQAILEKISHYPELLPQLEQAIQFWKDKVVETRDDRQYKQQLFVSQLLAAYFKKDTTALESVEQPDTFQGSVSELNYWGMQQFYKGLLLIPREPEAAAHIFNELAQRYPSYSSIALNRLVARLQLGEQKNDTDIFRAAYEEWKEYANRHGHSVDFASIEPGISVSLMTILLHLGEYAAIDDTFKRLDLPAKMNYNILEIQVKSLTAQKKTAEALSLVGAGKSYHQFSGYTQIQELDDLEALISGEDNVDELAIHYQRIFKSTASRLIKILPANFNGKLQLHEFLVKEIVHAADKMLEKIRSIDKIDNEDKYNDIIEMLLDARLNILGWHVGAQARGGYSAGSGTSAGTQPGERDLPIFDVNKKMLLLCEALIYRGQGNAAPHLQKVFNYYHQQEAFVMLFYDNGTIKKGFEGNWKEYLEEVLPNTTFSTGKEITGDIVDVTADYGCEASAIKVARSVHASNTVLYHVFINIHYKLE